MSYKFNTTYDVPIDNGGIDVEFHIEYEPYGWYKNQPGEINIINVSVGDYQCVPDGNGKFKYVPLNNYERDNAEHWLAATPLEFFEDDAADDLRNNPPEPNWL